MNTKKIIVKRLLAVVIVLCAMTPHYVAAQKGINNPLGEIGTIEALVRAIIDGAIALTAVIAAAAVVYGGFMYITAAGDDNKMQDAKNIILYAIIGVIVIALAGAIVNFSIGAIGGGGG